MSDATDKHDGFFIVPAEHLDELHALEAAIEEARSIDDYHYRLASIFYRRNQLFERAREVATVATVIEDSKYRNASSALWSWFMRCVHAGDQREVLNPDELAAMARELPDIQAEGMIRWVRKHRIVPRKTEPLLIELFDLLVRTVAAAPEAPSGFAMLSFYEKYRHPPEPPPPKPEPEPPPPDEDEGALMGWFAVPARHLDALKEIATARDAAFRQGRRADFHALETRLFERARAVARTSAVFNAWAYRRASRIWWKDLESEARRPMPPTFLDPESRDTWGFWMSRKRLATVREHAGSERPGMTEEMLAQVGELFQALRRVTAGKRAAGCGLVIAWWFARPPAWPRYDDASTRAARQRIYELHAQADVAAAQLRAIAAKQRRARARATDAAPGAGPDAAPATTQATTQAAAQDAAQDAARAVPAPARAQRRTQPMAQPMVELAAELTSRFPWLSRLPNRDHLVASLARQLDGAVPARIPIALDALLDEGFFAGDTSVERAGRQAMAAALAKHPAWVELAQPRRGRPEVRLYLDGRRLQVHAGGVSADAFFARGGGALLEVQAAWHQAVIEEGGRVLIALGEEHPYVMYLRRCERIRELNDGELLKRLDRQERAEARKARAKARKARAKARTARS